MNEKLFIPATVLTVSKVTDQHIKKVLRGHATIKSCYKQPGHRNGKHSCN